MLPDRPPAPRYYDLLMAGFVTVLICSNFIGPDKVVGLDLWLLGHVQFGAGNIFFPISYIFGDVLTEVYGYARARRVIWAGFAAMVFAAVMANVVIALPPSAEPRNAQLQPALERVFGPSAYIVLGSMLAFWAGDFANSYVMARLKVLTNGRYLWMRTIGSTIVGQGIDSFVFYPILGLAAGWQYQTMLAVILANWTFKVGVEVVMTPATYWACSRLKRAEGLDHFDRGTDFNPFSLRT